MRLLLGFVVVAAFVAAFFAMRWQIGRSFAELASPSKEYFKSNFTEIAATAKDFAPNDPLANLLFANSKKNIAVLNQSEPFVPFFENAAKLAPNDYRYWVDLARVRDQTGDTANSETAFRRAVELAPNYAYPRWLLGNLLLRSGRQTEAFAEFKRVAQNHSTLRLQVFYVLWETLNGNAAQLEQTVGDTPNVNTGLTLFYAVKNRPDDVLRVWNKLNPVQKEEARYEADTAAKTLYNKARYRTALILMRELGTTQAEIEKITNGGFENEITKSSDLTFDWQVQQIKGVDVTLDLRAPQEAKRSLRLTFNGYNEPTLQHVTQIVAVQPSTRYRMSFSVKTSELKSAGTPIVEVVDSQTTKSLTASAPFAIGSSEWKTVNLDFTTTPETEGILIRTTRQFCGENCPIVGSIWYDDFKLQNNRNNR